MSAKDTTMSAKVATMTAKDTLIPRHERQGRDHVRQGRDHDRTLSKPTNVHQCLLFFRALRPPPAQRCVDTFSARSLSLPMFINVQNNQKLKSKNKSRSPCTSPQVCTYLLQQHIKRFCRYHEVVREMLQKKQKMAYVQKL